MGAKELDFWSSWGSGTLFLRFLGLRNLIFKVPGAEKANVVGPGGPGGLGIPSNMITADIRVPIYFFCSEERGRGAARRGAAGQVESNRRGAARRGGAGRGGPALRCAARRGAARRVRGSAKYILDTL